MSKHADPFADITKMMSQFQLPGIDMSAFVEARRKDIEALAQANTAAVESMQALARRQQEMLAEAMHEIQQAATHATSGGIALPDPAKQADLTRKACEKALAQMTELAELARKSQSEVMASLSRRASENMEEIKNLMKPR